ncbi:hypothetical protein EVA_09017 [gut metagenome]|uniref:Uncharacterized protein n=1 Tax=gut metagenome TaxID=749906 RepID=J9CRQ9_9ZZZZ
MIQIPSSFRCSLIFCVWKALKRLLLIVRQKPVLILLNNPLTY